MLVRLILVNYREVMMLKIVVVTFFGKTLLLLFLIEWKYEIFVLFVLKLILNLEIYFVRLVKLLMISQF